MLDTFLSQALAYESVEAPSLQGFVALHPRQRERHQARGGGGGDRRARHDGAWREGARGRRRVPGRHRRRGRRAAASATCSSTIGKDRDDPAFLWRRDARRGAAAAARRRCDRGRGDRAGISAPALRRDDARARRALRRRHQAASDAADECWYTIVERCARAGRSVERDEDGELAAPFQWPQPPRAPLARRRPKTPLRRATRRSSRLAARSAAPTPVRRAAAAASLARLSPSPIRSPRLPSRVAARRRATRRCCAGASCICCCSSCRACRREARAAAAERLLAGEIARRSRACRDASAREADAVLGASGARRRSSRPKAAPRWRSSETSRPSSGDFAVSGRIDRLVRDRDRLAHGRLQDRPRRAGLGRARPTRPMSCSWRSTDSC